MFIPRGGGSDDAFECFPRLVLVAFVLLFCQSLVFCGCDRRGIDFTDPALEGAEFRVGDVCEEGAGKGVIPGSEGVDDGVAGVGIGEVAGCCGGGFRKGAAEEAVEFVD